MTIHHSPCQEKLQSKNVYISLLFWNWDSILGYGYRCSSCCRVVNRTSFIQVIIVDVTMIKYMHVIYIVVEEKLRSGRVVYSIILATGDPWSHTTINLWRIRSINLSLITNNLY